MEEIHIKVYLEEDLKEDEEIVNWAIEVTGLKEFEDRKLDSLSGGQRQRAWVLQCH